MKLQMSANSIFIEMTGGVVWLSTRLSNDFQRYLTRPRNISINFIWQVVEKSLLGKQWSFSFEH